MLRTVETGLERVRAFRMPDMATLGLALSQSGTTSPMGQLRSIVCDSHNAQAMLALADREPEHFAELKQVIAFEDDAFACDLLAHQRSRLVSQRISLLPMNTNLTTWVNLLRLIGSGGHYVPPHLLDLEGSARVRPERNGARPSDTSPPLGELTRREAEVLEMAAEGAPNKVIAHALDLSEHTVKLHMHRVIAKLGVKNRTEASVWFHQRNAHA